MPADHPGNGRFTPVYLSGPVFPASFPVTGLSPFGPAASPGYGRIVPCGTWSATLMRFPGRLKILRRPDLADSSHFIPFQRHDQTSVPSEIPHSLLPVHRFSQPLVR
jgi:hypothetical protein